MALFLREAVRARRNILVSGGTGSGKTTLLNIHSQFIPEKEPSPWRIRRRGSTAR